MLFYVSMHIKMQNYYIQKKYTKKVVAKWSQKKVHCCTSGQKSQINVTVIGCGSATGQVLSPFIIFAAKQLNHSWTLNEVSGSRYGVSDKGWVDQLRAILLLAQGPLFGKYCV